MTSDIRLSESGSMPLAADRKRVRPPPGSRPSTSRNEAHGIASTAVSEWAAADSRSFVTRTLPGITIPFSRVG